VWVIGDSGAADANAAAVRDAFLAYVGGRRAQVWLMLGDNAYEWGTDGEYQQAVFDMYPMLLRNTVVWPTRGNHDLTFPVGIHDYYDIFSMPRFGEAGGVSSGTEAYYSFDHANIHFICLDSQGSDLLPGSGMLDWLALDLAATAQDWVVAYWHHPPYSKGSHDSDDIIDSFGIMTLVRSNVLPILESGGVDLVLTGHSHSYERSLFIDGHYGFSWTFAPSMVIDDGDGRPAGDGAYTKPTLGTTPHEGTVYAVAGSSSKASGGPLNHPVMMTSINTLGSMVLDFSGNVLDAVFIDATGQVRDAFSIVKGITATAIANRPSSAPRIARARPNPFRAAIDIDFEIATAGRVVIAVYDVAGRAVRDLSDARFESGAHTIRWDGTNADGVRVVPGVYFGVVEYGGERRARKLIHIR
jgi:hypothetical protein